MFPQKIATRLVSPIAIANARKHQNHSTDQCNSRLTEGHLEGTEQTFGVANDESRGGPCGVFLWLAVKLDFFLCFRSVINANRIPFKKKTSAELKGMKSPGLFYFPIAVPFKGPLHTL